MIRERINFGLLLVATAVMYLWNITANGMANQFYAGAAQAGAKNWEALLFGSLDAHNFITVDKPPVSQWVMGLSGQLFGFSAASMLIPEALMAVATVALLYTAVRRVSGPWPALLAGTLFALTPVAALMFRYNNPDAVMVLLMTAAAYCTVRAVPVAGAKWIALAGAALGFAFLAKMLEGLMVAPAIGAAYLLAAPTTLGRRLAHLAGAAAACALSAGWFVVLTLLWPASSRPYLAGSTDNNFMNLVLGYNGFARVLGHNQGAADWVGFSHQPAPGPARLFSGEFGFEISWLMPAALLGFVAVLLARRGTTRTDPVRAAAILFGGWLLVDGLVLSYMRAMVHPYYSLSLAPAVAALVAIGGHQMWQRRESRSGRIVLAAMILSTGAWSWWLLGRNEHWLPVLRWALLALTVATTAVLLIALRSPGRQRLAAGALIGAVVVAAAGSGAYALATIDESHSGGMPIAGPATGHTDSHPGAATTDSRVITMLAATHTDWSAAVERSSAAAALELSSGTDVMAIGGFGGLDPAPTLAQFQDDVAHHRIGYYLRSDRHGHGGFGNRRHSVVDGWVTAHFAGTKMGSETVYDLTAAQH